jgi:hypothetical protein
MLSTDTRTPGGGHQRGVSHRRTVPRTPPGLTLGAGKRCAGSFAMACVGAGLTGLMAVVLALGMP